MTEEWRVRGQEEDQGWGWLTSLCKDRIGTRKEWQRIDISGEFGCQKGPTESHRTNDDDDNYNQNMQL